MTNVPAVIRLYRAPFSTNVERVALALAHKGLAVESIIIDYSDRSEVERVSGQELVPVIEDNGTVVIDSMEIVRYPGRLRRRTHLAASGPFQKCPARDLVKRRT